MKLSELQHAPTETASLYDHLDEMSVVELLQNINKEDQKVALAVSEAIPQIEQLVLGLVERMKAGGRLFYAGAGTSGRLGILDASEIPPTYGVEPGLVIGVIAGGDKAIRAAVEGAEDNPKQGWTDLQFYNISERDTLVGVAASGRTPYVLGALQQARAHGVFTGCITCNPGSALALLAEVPIVAAVGPEFVTGSTRMKAGTAQKLILNMITTAAMIRLGRVKGNKMVDMQLSNQKLVERGVRMLMEEVSELDYTTAKSLMLMHGSVRKAMLAWDAMYG